jgi:NO-binding membrane sensor protein with MHYT domain
MGAVAIWSMHFIGNRAITMFNGEPELQIDYSPGFTAGSFFLPIIFVGIAFMTFKNTETINVWRTGVGGFICGSAICGMHYLGQLGIDNYTNVWDVRYIVGSAVIAVVAATAALGVFFHFKFAWTNAWWKRGLCALLLASAVSGMHWVATAGTNYRSKGIQKMSPMGLSRASTAGVVGALVGSSSRVPDLIC